MTKIKCFFPWHPQQILQQLTELQETQFRSQYIHLYAKSWWSLGIQSIINSTKWGKVIIFLLQTMWYKMNNYLYQNGSWLCQWVTYFPKVGTRVFLHQDQSPTTIPMTRDLPRQTLCAQVLPFKFILNWMLDFKLEISFGQAKKGPLNDNRNSRLCWNRCTKLWHMTTIYY